MGSAGRRFRIAAVEALASQARALEREVETNRHGAGSDWSPDLAGDDARIAEIERLQDQATDLLDDLLGSDVTITHRRG
jgi:hypothetical protein